MLQGAVGGEAPQQHGYYCTDCHAVVSLSGEESIHGADRHGGTISPARAASLYIELLTGRHAGHSVLPLHGATLAYLLQYYRNRVKGEGNHNSNSNDDDDDDDGGHRIDQYYLRPRREEQRLILEHYRSLQKEKASKVAQIASLEKEVYLLERTILEEISTQKAIHEANWNYKRETEIETNLKGTLKGVAALRRLVVDRANTEVNPYHPDSGGEARMLEDLARTERSVRRQLRWLERGDMELQAEWTYWMNKGLEAGGSRRRVGGSSSGSLAQHLERLSAVVTSHLAERNLMNPERENEVSHSSALRGEEEEEEPVMKGAAYENAGSALETLWLKKQTELLRKHKARLLPLGRRSESSSREGGEEDGISSIVPSSGFTPSQVPADDHDHDHDQEDHYRIKKREERERNKKYLKEQLNQLIIEMEVHEKKKNRTE